MTREEWNERFYAQFVTLPEADQHAIIRYIEWLIDKQGGGSDEAAENG